MAKKQVVCHCGSTHECLYSRFTMHWLLHHNGIGFMISFTQRNWEQTVTYSTSLRWHIKLAASITP